MTLDKLSNHVTCIANILTLSSVGQPEVYWLLEQRVTLENKINFQDPQTKFKALQALIPWLSF